MKDFNDKGTVYVFVTAGYYWCMISLTALGTSFFRLPGSIQRAMDEKIIRLLAVAAGVSVL